MMKKLFQNMAIMLMAAMLIMATGGFSIYHHFCRCAGESTASIFMEGSCDHEQAVIPGPSSCCAGSEQESCCTNQPLEEKADACHQDECCNTSFTYLKIFDNFTVSLEKISLKFVISFVQILSGIELQSQAQTSVVLKPEFNDTSPPLFGTDLLNTIHQLKIAHSQA